MRTLNPARTPEYRAVMSLVVVVGVLAVTGSVIPAVEHAVNVGMLGLGVLAAVLGVARLLVRLVRERIEDAADARTAAAWRPAHQTDRSARTPAGVS